MEAVAACGEVELTCTPWSLEILTKEYVALMVKALRKWYLRMASRPRRDWCERLVYSKLYCMS